MVVAQTGFGTAFLRSLLLPLVFLAPGVPALRLKRWAARRSGRPPRLQLIVYGTILSGFSLLTLYFGVSWLNWELVTVETLNDLSLPQGVLLFVVHLGLTCVYGVLAGEAQYNYYTGNRPRDLYDSWDFAFEKVYQGDDVVVKTTGGTWIRGRVVQSGSSEGKRDLLFESARILDVPEDGTPSVEPTQESTSQIQYEGNEILGGTDSIDESSGMDQILSRDSVKTQAGNYIYIDGKDIQTVVFYGEINMDPAHSINTRKTGAAQELLGGLVQGSVDLPSLPQNPLRGHGFPLLLVTLVSAVVALAVVPAQFGLSSDETAQFSSLVGLVAASATTLYHQTEVFTRLKRVMNVNIGARETLYGFGAVAVVGSYSPVLSAEIVPLLVGTVVGVTITTVHLSLSRRFGVQAALYSLLLASLPVLVSFVWIDRGVSSQFGRAVSLVWVAAVVLLVVNRLRIGTPSSYNEWPDVARYTAWWVATVGLSVVLVAVSFAPDKPVVRVETGVLLLIGWLLALYLRRTVRSDLS